MTPMIGEHDAGVPDDEARDRHAAALLTGLLDLAQRDVPADDAGDGADAPEDHDARDGGDERDDRERVGLGGRRLAVGGAAGRTRARSRRRRARAAYAGGGVVRPYAGAGGGAGGTGAPGWSGRFGSVTVGVPLDAVDAVLAAPSGAGGVALDRGIRCLRCTHYRGGCPLHSLRRRPVRPGSR